MFVCKQTLINGLIIFNQSWHEGLLFTDDVMFNVLSVAHPVTV